MAKRQLNKDTTRWVDVAITTPALKKAHAEYRKAMDVVKALRAKMEAVKTAELVKAGKVVDGYRPVFGHRFGWSIATEKADGTIIQVEAGEADDSGPGAI